MQEAKEHKTINKMEEGVGRKRNSEGIMPLDTMTKRRLSTLNALMVKLERIPKEVAVMNEK